MFSRTIFIMIFGIIVFLSCTKDEKPVNPYPRASEFYFLYNGEPTSIIGGFDYFSFESLWKPEPIIENSVMDSILSLGFYHPLDNRISYMLAFSYKIWYDGNPNRIYERLDLNSQISGIGRDDFRSYYFNRGVIHIDYFLDPEFDNYLQVTYISPDRKEIRGEISFSVIVEPKYAGTGSARPDTMTYEQGRFRIKNLY